MFRFSFKDKYKAYKEAVIKRVSKSLSITAGMQHSIESWIRDYFLDGYDVDDCVHAITHNVHESIKYQEELKLVEAKRTLRKNNYKITKRF